MADLYELSIYNTSGVKQIIVQGWTRFEFTQRLNAPYNHSLTLEMASDDPASVFYRETLGLDWILEAVRTDPLTGVKEIVYEGFHRTLVDQAKKSGDIIFNLYGPGYTDLLDRSVVIPAAGSEVSAKSGMAETVAKNYVTEQQASPTDSARTVSGLSVEADTASGKIASYSARYTNLLTVLQRVADQGDIDFGVVRGATVGTFIFRAKPVWGTDRGVGNLAGIAPTVFDMGFGNMSIPILSDNNDNEVNFAYVGGSGQGTNRTIASVYNEPKMEGSIWNRHEAFVNASQDSDADSLITRGRAYLLEHESTKRLNFKIAQTIGTRWLEDWELGDIVTATYFGLTFLKKIIEVNVAIISSVNSQREYIQIDMEDEFVGWLLGVVGKSELGSTTRLE